jgi:hypothetical protein
MFNGSDARLHYTAASLQDARVPRAAGLFKVVSVQENARQTSGEFTPESGLAYTDRAAEKNYVSGHV